MKHITKLVLIAVLMFVVGGYGYAYAEGKNSAPISKKDSPITVTAKNDERVSFNFVDVELSALTKFISDITRKNIIFDDQFKGKITIVAPEPLSVSEAFKLFTSILELKSYAVIPSGKNTYKIVPMKLAKEMGISVTQELDTAIDENYAARLIELKHLSEEDAISFLRPLVSKNGYIKDFGPRNMLLIMDSTPNIDRILQLMDMIDTPSETAYPEIIKLNYASAKNVAAIINEGLKGGLVGADKKTAGSIRQGVYVVDDTRLNALILFGPETEREPIKKLITMLDTPTPEAQGNINVYFLENADAVELAGVLEKLITKSTTASSTSAKNTETDAKTKQQKPFKQASDIFITPDEATNSLLIVAPPSDYRSILEVIKKLDKRRKQVFVEAMIMEVSLEGIMELGTKWRGAAKSNGKPIFISGVGSIDSSSVEQILTGLGGFSVGGMGNFMDVSYTTTNSDGTTETHTLTAPGYAVLFSAKEFRGVLNVLSTPQILTSDNQEAEIVVGENVPFITKREANPSSDTSVFSTIERKDVGIKLTITPQITEGDYVKLDIYQEISNVKDQSTEILISVGPTTTKRSTKTSVVVKDKQTVVIGGLIEEKRYKSITKVPVLGDIPGLGWLFKTKGDEKAKINLMVFLTPYVIEDAKELNELTKRKVVDTKEQDLQKEDKKTNKEETTKTNKYNTASNNNKIGTRLLVEFVDGVSTETALEIIEQAGTLVVSRYGEREFYLVQLKPGVSIVDAQESLEANAEVKVAEPQRDMQ
ncbi:MAG: type II secretion system secretin GspD [Candidatus Magnetoovum sp. WYHC-5]|nr:type II secretion system secretin GspD [Candidatus Magnetoovum sp. WYHC-5]